MKCHKLIGNTNKIFMSKGWKTFHTCKIITNNNKNENIQNHYKNDI